MNEPTSRQPPAREARYDRRHALPGQPQVFDMLAERVMGLALDLSAGGLKLLIPEPLVADTLYQVSFPLDMGGGERATVIAGLQILDQREDAGGMLQAGTRFIHLEGAHAREVVRWLAMQAARG